MAALELEGRISQKFAKQSGQSARGPWVKQDFILEYQDGNYPSQVCFTSFGDDKVAELDRYGVGDEVKVSFNVRAHQRGTEHQRLCHENQLFGGKYRDTCRVFP